MSSTQPNQTTQYPKANLKELWAEVGFKPNEQQKAAILHVKGPLCLPAGPGSGKTRVLLWRVVNLLANHDVPPAEVFLSTFTEKAALQLKEGIRALLGLVTERTGRPFDLAKLYVGTIHSLCRVLLTDRRFSPDHHRTRPPVLMDDLTQYLYLYRDRNWKDLLDEAGIGNGANQNINVFFGKYTNEKYASSSRHKAVSSIISLSIPMTRTRCVDHSWPQRDLRRRRRRVLRALTSTRSCGVELRRAGHLF